MILLENHINIKMQKIASFFKKILTFHLGEGVKERGGGYMKIKEVETKTHLSSKTIRFYEDKGLITIQRDRSGYRHYTDENVKELLTIKVYRQCGLSLQEIKDVQKGKIMLDDLLYQKISEYDKRDFELSEQKDFCLNVILAQGEYEELYEEIEIKESDDYNELVDLVVGAHQKSLSIQILQTFVFLGPILSFFFYYHENQVKRLMWCFVISLFSVMFMTLSWKNFLNHYKFHKETILQGLKHTLSILLILIFVLASTLGIFILLTTIQQKIYFQGTVYLFTQSGWITGITIVIVVSIIAILCLSQYAIHFDFHDYDDYIVIANWIRKHIYLWICMIIIVFYAFITNTSTVSESQITYYSFFHPQGYSYDYNEIDKVECGFYGKSSFFGHDKGDFYYHVTLKDGKVIALDDNQTLSQYEDETYSELVVFDNQVMKNHVKKISSLDNQEYALYDQEYIDRFLSIIENK